MKPFLLIFAAAVLYSAPVRSAELNATDPSPVARPVIPVEPRIRPIISNMHVSLDVLVDGKPARVISYNGKLYLPVPRMGAEYEIRVNNNGSRRIAAIVSVDGLSVIKGEPASEKSPGYLVSSHDGILIKGWRRDTDRVAAFTFEERRNSYAYSRGYRDNIGVIGLIAVEELTPMPRTFEFYREKTAPRSPDAALGGTGTGWGRDIDSSVVTVPFVRSANKQTVTIYYDTEDALRRIGVPVDGRLPRPFPADTDFCPPPSRPVR